MAYDTKELEKKALAAIKRHKLVFIEDVVSYLPCSKPTFYEHKLNEVNALKDALEANKVKTKAGLRQKWYDNDNATTQIALYKLLSSDDELRRLTGQTIIGDKEQPLQIQVALNKNDTISDAIE